MTSAPVNGVGSFLNFVGSKGTQTVNMKAAPGSFGDVMSKTSGNQTDAETMGSVNHAKDTQTSQRHPSYTGKEISKAESGKQKSVAGKADKNREEALKEAGNKLVKEVADKLGVSEEEVIDAMEELGFGITALLNTDNLTQLVLAISGEESFAFLTNEGLYGSVQDLLKSLEEIRNVLAEELGVTNEEVTQLIENSIVEEQMSEEVAPAEENPVISNRKETEEKKQPEITVTIEQGEKNIKLSADENGNEKQVETVVSKGKTADREQEHKENQKQESMQDGSGTENPMLDGTMQGKATIAETSFEQTALYMTPKTTEIMEQILDYVKIHLKPGMDQLQMQLHPESLGTLHIQLTSKGGEVTAHFKVQNEEVKAAIEGQIADLKENLKEQGIKVEAVEVTVESHAFESNLWQGQEREEKASYQNSRKTRRRINLNDLEESAENRSDEAELTAKMMEANGNTIDYTA